MAADWPNDADGDVLRNLQKKSFDFGRAVKVDFFVDFFDWPPCETAIASIKRAKPDACIKLYSEDQYILIEIIHEVTYDFVVSVQAELTNICRPFGGVCESWGVLHHSAL